MGTYDGRMGVVGIFLTPKADKFILSARDYAGQYQWLDTLYYELFTSYSGITLAKLPTNTSMQISNGLQWPSSTGTGLAKILVTNNDSLTNLVPSNSVEIKLPIAYTGNRGSNTLIIDGTANFTGSESKTYILRISQSGISGVAKCDIVNEDGTVYSSNTIIYQNTVIDMQDGIKVKFTDAGPFYLHDSWAIRGVRGIINKLAAHVDYVGDPIISGLRIYMKNSGNREGELVSGVDTIDIPYANLGKAYEFGNGLDFYTDKSGSNLHVGLFLNKTDASQQIIVHGLYIALGDSEEYNNWSS